jgi:hypothetical protein
MNPSERKLLDKLDKLVMNVSAKEFKKIQEIDLLTQMDGQSLCDTYLNHSPLANQSIKQESREYKK